MFKIVSVLCLAVFLVGCGDNIDEVKNGVMGFNKTTTLGKALDSYKLCNDKNWDSFETDSGVEVVEFVCIKNDLKNSINKSKIKPKLTFVKEIFQFTINIDGSFQLDNVQQEFEWVDGKKASNAENAIDRLKIAYENDITLDDFKIFSGFIGVRLNNMARMQAK